MHDNSGFQSVMKNDIALYIHIPFCVRKCSYCSFVSYDDRMEAIPAYIAALKQELALRVTGKNVGTIYFGGGTPSLLPSGQIAELLAAVRSLYNVDRSAEITIEANPGTIDLQYLAALKAAGINRLSLGVQSFDDKELTVLGRIHSRSTAIEAIETAHRSGFTNLNIDLIYGLPGQTLASWNATLTEAINLGIQHLSLYPLSLEGTEPLSRAIGKGELPALDSDLCAEQYELAEEILAASNFQHYELSNWAIEGYECRHNLVYWSGLPYIGVGVAAHSYTDGHRLANTNNLDEYLQSFQSAIAYKPHMDEEINRRLQLSEAIILGLRLNQGVSLNAIGNRFGVDVLNLYREQIDSMVYAGLLELIEGSIRLTGRGRLLGNEVFLRFLPVS